MDKGAKRSGRRATLSLLALCNLILHHSGHPEACRTTAGAKKKLADLHMSTELNHVNRVGRLLQAIGSSDVADLYRRRQDVVDYLERPGAYTSSSRMSFYSSLCALINPDKPYSQGVAAAAGRSEGARARRVFLERNAYWNRKVGEKQLRLTRAASEEGGAIPFGSILRMYRNKRRSLEPQDRLLADMYLASPDDPAGAVRRANYGCCWVFNEEPDERMLPVKANFVVVPADRRKNVTLVLNRYKTSRSHGEYRARLPPKLSSIVRESLSENPRPLLFYRRSDGEFHCLNTNSFAKRVSSVMKDITGRPLGVNQLRRSYSSYIIDKDLSDEDRRRFAQGMNSSVDVMEKVYKRRYLMTEKAKRRG